MKNLSRRGFTAIEILIGVALIGMLALAVSSMQVFLGKKSSRLQSSLESALDANLAERILFRDFNGLDPSYNNLNLLDDNGNNFFDYYPDVPATALSNRLDRVLKISLSGERKQFIVLIQDQKTGPMVNYDPVAAYDVGPVPADFNSSATLTFKGLNKNGWVAKLYPANSRVWTQGRVLMLDTPARLRPLNERGRIDMTMAPRSPIFIGTVNGINLRSQSLISNIVNTTHPTTNTVIGSVDTFLREVPSVGGGQSIVRLRPLKVVKYYLKKQNDQTYEGNPAYLYRTTFENGTWGEEVLIADKVSELELSRDSVLKRMLYFKIIKAQKKNN